MEDGNRKVLVAVNGSDDSMTAVRYISESLPKRGSELTLYQVMSAIPEEFWDLEKDPVWIKKVEAIRSWEAEQKIFLRLRPVQRRSAYQSDVKPCIERNHSWWHHNPAGTTLVSVNRGMANCRQRLRCISSFQVIELCQT